MSPIPTFWGGRPRWKRRAGPKVIVREGYVACHASAPKGTAAFPEKSTEGATSVSYAKIKVLPNDAPPVHRIFGLRFTNRRPRSVVGRPQSAVCRLPPTTGFRNAPIERSVSASGVCIAKSSFSRALLHRLLTMHSSGVLHRDRRQRVKPVSDLLRFGPPFHPREEAGTKKPK